MTFVEILDALAVICGVGALVIVALVAIARSV
jgi:hypothetical protein